LGESKEAAIGYSLDEPEPDEPPEEREREAGDEEPAGQALLPLDPPGSVGERVVPRRR
jgi:hypothetical protein